MPNIIPVEMAVNQGVTPESLVSTAEWHIGRAALLNKALGGDKKALRAVQSLGKIGPKDVARHEETARLLIARSKELAAALRSAAA